MALARKIRWILIVAWIAAGQSAWAQAPDSLSPAMQQPANAVRFCFYHREYGYKRFDQGPGKPQRSVPYLKDGYPAIYALSAERLTIYKVAGKQHHAVVVKSLSKEQKAVFKRIFAETNFAALADSSVIVGIDDGFQVEVKIHKSGKDIALFWSNAYVKPLVELFDIVNELSPDAFRVYKLSEKELFVEQLRKNTR